MRNQIQVFKTRFFNYSLISEHVYSYLYLLLTYILTYSGLLTQGESKQWKDLKTSLPPIWVEKVEGIEEDINNINIKLKELSALHTKRLLVNFETDESQQEIDIDNKENEIKGLLRHAEGLVKKIFKVVFTY